MDGLFDDIGRPKVNTDEHPRSSLGKSCMPLCRKCYPWNSEIRPRVDPPDVNYRPILEFDEALIKQILENQ